MGSATDVSPLRVTLAWGVHLFTASGAVLGAIALLAIGSGDFALAAVLMLVATLIDSVDGTLARRVGVAEVLPQIDGRRLDDLVDYLNFVVVPAVFMVAAGQLAHWSLTAFPILASAYGFSQADAKTEDDFFLGWPSYWNILAIYLWLFEYGPAGGTAMVVFFAALVFVPLKYVYPSKLRVLKKTTNAGGILFGFALGLVVLYPEESARIHLLELTLIYPAYYYVLSLWLGGFAGGKRRA